MTRFVSTSIALLCALTLFALLAFVGCSGPPSNNSNTKPMAGTPPPAFNCTAKSQGEIILAMYAVIEYKGWADQQRQFNITANPGATPKPTVTISGWSKDRGLIITALETAAVGCTVDYQQTFFTDKAQLGSNPTAPSANYVMRIGCPPNTGPCGDICVPIGEPCKITGDKATNTAWPCGAYKAEDSKVVMSSPSPKGNVKSSNSSK